MDADIEEISPPSETFDEFCRRRFLEIIQEKPELQDNKDAVAKMLTDEWSMLNQKKEFIGHDM